MRWLFCEKAAAAAVEGWRTLLKRNEVESAGEKMYRADMQKIIKAQWGTLRFKFLRDPRLNFTRLILFILWIFYWIILFN